MQRIIFIFIVIFVYTLTSFAQQSKGQKNNSVGTWKFEAPYAPEGYTSGTIEVGFAEKKYSASMMFSGSEYKLNGEKVKIENDTISFSVFIEDQDVAVKLKMENSSKMSGKAVYTEGEVPLALTREMKK